MRLQSDGLISTVAILPLSSTEKIRQPQKGVGEESIEAALFNTGKALSDDNISCASSLAKEIPPLSSLACWVGVTGRL
mgnify:CR=1 FL=1